MGNNWFRLSYQLIFFVLNLLISRCLERTVGTDKVRICASSYNSTFSIYGRIPSGPLPRKHYVKVMRHVISLIAVGV